MRRIFGLTAGMAGLALSCAPLESPAVGVCGNGIVEPAAAEDCDGDPQCASVDGASACLWSCAEDECPRGTCGLDGVCRSPSAQLELGLSLDLTNVPWMRTADVDGDGRQDLIALDENAAGTTRRLVVTFFDAERQVDAQWEQKGMPRSPVGIADQDGDGWLDLFTSGPGRQFGSAQGPMGPPMLSSAALVLLRNADGRSFAPAPAASNWRERRNVRVLGALPDISPNAGPFVFSDDGMRSITGDDDTGVITNISFPAVSDDDSFAVNPAVGVYECGRYSALATIDGSSPGVADQFLAHSMTAICNSPGAFSSKWIALPPGATGQRQPWVRLVDANEDGWVDFIGQDGDAGTETRVRVAYGLPDGTFASDPAVLPAEDGDNTFADPPLISLGGLLAGQVLALGRLDDDDVLDFVARDASGEVFVGRSDVACQPGIPPKSGWACDCSPNHACAWTGHGPSSGEAKIGDFDGDGVGDVVFHSGDDRSIVYLLGDGERFIVRSIVVANTPTDIEIGDFDGDGIDDTALAFEVDDPGQDTIGVVWGRADDASLELALTADFTGGLAVGRDPSAVPQPDRLFALATDAAVPASEAPTGLVSMIIAERAIRSGTDLAACEWNWPGDVRIIEAGRFTADGVRATLVSDDPAFGDTMCMAGLFQAPNGVIRLSDSRARRFSVATGSPWTYPLAGGSVADADGDGVDELVVLGSASSGFSPEAGTMVGTVHMDVPVGHPPTLSLVPGAVPRATWPAGSTASPVLDDLDGDGDIDLIVLTGASAEAVTGGALVLSNRGNGSFHGEPLTVDGSRDVLIDHVAMLGPTGTVAAVGVQRDGIRELKIGTLTGAAFETQHVLAGVAGPIDAADFDGDGLIDLALARPGGGVQIAWGTPGFEDAPEPPRPEDECGNGEVNAPVEQCDGDGLDGWTCFSLGFSHGALACDPDRCVLDTVGCFANCDPSAELCPCTVDPDNCPAGYYCAAISGPVDDPTGVCQG